MIHLENTLGLALSLLLCCGVVAVAGPLVETRQRAPEGTARAYLWAIEQGDLAAALAVFDPGGDPADREALRERVALQARNRYEIGTVVVGKPSLIDRLTGRQLPAAWVTVTASVTTITGERWQSTSTAPLVERDGVWFLVGPLFA
jgi:hypothetical protein